MSSNINTSPNDTDNYTTHICFQCEKIWWLYTFSFGSRLVSWKKINVCEFKIFGKSNTEWDTPKCNRGLLLVDCRGDWEWQTWYTLQFVKTYICEDADCHVCANPNCYKKQNVMHLIAEFATIFSASFSICLNIFYLLLEIVATVK